MKARAILMDLSKAFDTLNHRILLAKLKAYGLRVTDLKQMENYLTDLHHRTEVNNAFSWWFQIIAVVPQGSVFRVNIYLFKVNNRNTRKRCERC